MELTNLQSPHHAKENKRYEFFFLTLSFAQCIVELLLRFQQEIVRFVYNLQVADISRVENRTCGLVLQAKALTFPFQFRL